MRSIYLIARREYLSYVATWGFWLSLLSVPMFMLIGGGLPALVENSQPTRYYSFVDETGQDYIAAIERQFAEGQREDALEAVREIASQLGREDRLAQAEAALNAEPGTNGLPEAMAALGVPGTDALADRNDRFIQVAPPAPDAEGLRPYLLGEQTIDTPDGPQPLYAAIIFRSGGEYGVQIDYWSAHLTDNALRNRVESAVRALLRSQRLEAEGISQVVLAEVNAIDPDARELNPERSGGDAEVRDAERIPFFVGIAMAFALWIVVFSVVNMLLTAMIEEKGNKILEVLLASARFHEILIGKLAGVAAVSATLLVFWGSLSLGGLVGVQAVASSNDFPAAEIIGAILDPGLLLPALGYFVIGYLMFGSVFLAIGSLCDTLQEAQSLMSPIFLVMMVPLFIIVSSFDAPDSAFIQYASWVPLWTPFLMMARLPTDPPTIELIVTTLLMIGTAFAIIGLAGFVFRQGALGRANADSARKFLKFGKKKKAEA